MKSREKLLASGVALIGLIWLGKPTFDSIFVESLNSRDATINSLRSSIEQLDLGEIKLAKAQRLLKDAKAESLPPDPLDAHRVYADWMTDLLKEAKWEGLALSLGPRQARGQTMITIPLTITGQARTGQIQMVLKRLQETRLMQRVTRLDLDSQGATIDPIFRVQLDVEGVAVSVAPKRTRLFPVTQLSEPLAENSLTMVVTDSGSFPSVPFQVQIEEERIDVVAADDRNWKIQRSTYAPPKGHAKGCEVEIVPLKLGQTAAPFASMNWFEKPRPKVVRNPKISLEGTTLFRGKSWTSKVKVTDWEPGHGPPVLSLSGQPPEGVMLDLDRSSLSWDVSAEEPLGGKSVSLIAKTLAGDVLAKETFSLDVRRQNQPPVLNKLRDRTVYLGRPISLMIKGVDPDGKEDVVTYRMTPTLPGAQFNSQTGEFSWAPSIDLPNGVVTVSITAQDSGTPPLTDTQSWKLTLVDDPIRFTRLEGCLVEESMREAWFKDRSTDKRFVVHPGDDLLVGDALFSIVSIQTTGVILSLETDFGSELSELPIGKSLYQRKSLDLPDLNDK